MSRNMKIIIFTLIIVSILFAIPVFAASNTCAICGGYHDMSKLSAFQRLAYNTSCKAYGGNLLDGDLVKVLSLGSGSLFSQALPVIYRCYDALMPIGLVLLIVYFTMSVLGDVTMKDAETGEYFILQIFKLIIAVCIMYMGKDIINALLDSAQGIFAAINTYSSSTNVTLVGDCIYKELADMSDLNIWTPLLIALKNLIFWICSFILSVCINVAAASKMLELGVRIIFAPIGMSDIYIHGTNGKGFRYLKGLLAVALESSVMLMTMLLYRSILSDTLLFGGSVSLFTSIVLSCVAVSVFFKGKEVCNRMLGL